MTRIFYDTEFRENGRTIDLISIGMIREDNGAELYLINREAPWHDIVHHEWLRQNVLTSLPMTWPCGRDDNPGIWLWDREHLDITAVVAHSTIAHRVAEFVLAAPAPQLWAWYGAYDHVALAQLWGPMINLPDGVPMWTNDLRQECERLGNPQLPEQPEGEHNALADARHNMVRAQFLDALPRAQADRCVSSHCVEGDHVIALG
ncbi:hypothetical protein AB0420_02270 [Streptomyces caelestis]|uniref:hypothetical protein n=1 Tax=Streptomyces caelestis TaxID=36816 RepID=UPI00344D22E6